MIHFFVTLLFVCAIASLFWWAFNRLAVPEPFKTIVLLLVGLALIMWLFSAFNGGSISFSHL